LSIGIHFYTSPLTPDIGEGRVKVKVYRVINGEIDEQERDIKGPYYNNAPHIGSIKSKPHPKPKGPLKV
jgi:hypothetical protein